MSDKTKQSLAPTAKRTLAEFLEFIPEQWNDAELGIQQNWVSSSEVGYYRVKRVMLTVDSNGRRCVIFSSNETSLIL